MKRPKKSTVFKVAAILFLAAILFFTFDFMRKSSPPGTKKKWGVEAVKEGRDTFKKQLPYKHKIEKRVGPDSLD